MELTVVMMMIATKEIFEKSLGFFLKDSCVSGPITVRKLKPVNSVFFLLIMVCA
jgi:hypothetical protein